MATNPADSLPQADDGVAALKACPFVVVSDVARHTDTTAHAHVLLPAAAWGEKDGTVTNSERRISRQRAFLPRPGEARPDWWIITQVARRMGFAEAFPYETPHDIFDEYARLTTIGNSGTRDLDLGGLAGLAPSAYDRLAPVQWPVRTATATAPASPATAAEQRFFADGSFFTPDRRGRFVTTPYRPPASVTSPDYPLALNTGRIRDQWHTMTRTAKTPRLMAHLGEPFAEIHPTDAGDAGLSDAELVEVASRHGRMIARALITDRQQAGTVFVPMHWTGQVASCARVDALVIASTDPVSGQPELKFTPVSIRRFAARWHGFCVTRDEPAAGALDEIAGYWARARTRSGWRVELAGTSEAGDLPAIARALLARSSDNVEVVAYHDTRAGHHRFVAFERDRMVGALYVAPEPVAVSRTWAAQQLDQVFGDVGQRMSLLAGRAGIDRPDPGATVCACFEIGRNQIAAAITGGCGTVDEIGRLLKAGTNCGSCRAEIGRLVDAHRVAKAG